MLAFQWSLQRSLLLWCHTTGLAESFNATFEREVLREQKVFDNPIACRYKVFCGQTLVEMTPLARHGGNVREATQLLTDGTGKEATYAKKVILFVSIRLDG